MIVADSLINLVYLGVVLANVALLAILWRMVP